MSGEQRKQSIGSPAFWAMIAIPTAAVLASFVTLGLAIQGSDAELPKVYATEGSALDIDLALLGAAKYLGVKASLDVDRNGKIRAQVQGPAIEELPESLSLTLTHVIDATRDQKIDLIESADAGVYLGHLDGDFEGRWLLQLDYDSVWRLRSRIEIPANNLSLGD